PRGRVVVEEGCRPNVALDHFETVVAGLRRDRRERCAVGRTLGSEPASEGVAAVTRGIEPRGFGEPLDAARDGLSTRASASQLAVPRDFGEARIAGDEPETID